MSEMMKERERESGDKRAIEARVSSLDEQLREAKTQLAVLQSQVSERRQDACGVLDRW